MNNLEKYKDELENLENRSLVCFIAKEKVGLRCDVGYCLKCEKEAFKWLLEECKEEECKEPILTDKEKAYLKNVIEPQRNDIAYVTKWVFNPRKENEYFPLYVYMRNRYNSNYVFRLLEFITTKDMPFEGLETLKIYTLEELGL